ncbi:MAG: hypothetical protein IKJ30_01460 [Bacilli bacterium]|nr:hypothetical protein [Bacilli bacterium]
MDLIENLEKSRNKNNVELIDELVYFLKDANIKDLKQLEKFEDLTFTVNGKKLDTKNRIKYYYESVKDSFIDYDGLALEEVLKIKKLKDSLITKINDKQKIINIIYLNILTGREIKFYVEAYYLATKGKL